jgi:hypothetical protein
MVLLLQEETEVPRENLMCLVILETRMRLFLLNFFLIGQKRHESNHGDTGDSNATPRIGESYVYCHYGNNTRAHYSLKMSHKTIPSFRFLQTGLKSDFNKLRMKLSEIGNLQLESLNRKSRQLQRAISRDLRTEDSIYFSEVDAPQFTHCFYPQRTDCRFSQRQPFASIEVVNLD